ncbi:MAG: molybdenum cofactor biosynthesis protein MoaE [Gammaproteobacteria bacterium]|nr:molybdenum cofactor biosynthesis protein MoaE [Gammaproteobacteria bacterium]
MIVRVQAEDFDPEQEAQALAVTGAGARVSFVGTVRDFNATARVTALEIEHYPRMTEAELTRVAHEAQRTWGLLDVLVVHRYGRLHAGDRIVLVVTWALHRKAAFRGCEEIIDVLKTRAPFWKKEITGDGDIWIEGETPQT